MEAHTQQEKWEVDAGGDLFEADLAQLRAWINDGSVLRIDRVRKGHLRWIEAGKVPTLIEFFDAKDSDDFSSQTVLGDQSGVSSVAINPTGSHAGVSTSRTAPSSIDSVCSLHEEVRAVYKCKTCENHFCKTCPNSYGGTVKICPFCGAMCQKIERAQPATTHPPYYPPVGGFGLADIFESLAYPFRFKTSLLIGALMFMLLSIGQSVGSMGILFMWGSIVCFMLANTLTFGVLANTVENFSQGKIGLNFMPSFDEFSIWDDVVHPFFLMIGVYISSFGPLIAVFVLAFFFIVSPVQSEIQKSQAEASSLIDRQLPYAANAARQSREVRELIEKNEAAQKDGLSTIERDPTLIEEPEPFLPSTGANDPSEQEVMEVQKLIDETRKAQLESVVGKHPDTVEDERIALLRHIIGYGAVLLVAAGICFLWGVFYYPAACAVAGYTRSFVATINPTVGLDTIRRLGIVYVKILLMGLVLAIASAMIGGFLAVIFAPFDLPHFGNLPANAIGSFLGFYFFIVFSCIIGFALYKSADKLQLYR